MLNKENNKDYDKDDDNNNAIKTTYYVYDNEDILMEYNDKGKITATYTHGLGIDEPLAFTNKHGETYYYHADGLGSITALTDNKQKVVQTYEYDSFGNIKQQGHKIKQHYTYTGREYDEETGLYYYRARYYDAKNGRFISKDPIGFAGRDVNLYRYVENNPVNYVDPIGLMSDTLATTLKWGWGVALSEPTVVGEAIMATITIGFIGYEIYSRARSQSDPYTLPTVNPGRDCKGKCKPCPPNSPVWEHTHADGTINRHQIIYRQDPKTCTCYPERIHL